jgi:hypothetical protein
MSPDFLKTDAFHKGAADRVFRKYPAGELVQPGRCSRLDQCGEYRAAGAAAAIIPPRIDREFADTGVARARAIREGGKED